MFSTAWKLIKNLIAYSIVVFILGTYAVAGIQAHAYGILIIPAFGVFLWIMAGGKDA